MKKENNISCDVVKFPKVCMAATLMAQISYLLLLLVSNNIKFATNDDTTIVALLSGSYGFDNYFSINMNVVLSWLISRLFKYLPMVNWVTVFFLIVLMASFSQIAYIVFIERATTSRAYNIFKVIALFIMFTYGVGYFTFTVISYISAIAATCCALAIMVDEGKPIYYIRMTIFFTISALIRSDCILTAGAFASITCLVLGLLDKPRIKAAIIVVACIMVTGIACLSIDQFVESRNATQREFREWGETRSAAMDGAHITWEQASSEFEEAGITQTDLRAIEGIFYYDLETASKSTFEKIMQFTPIGERYSFDILSAFNSICAQFSSLSWENCITWFTIIICLASLGHATPKQRVVGICMILLIVGIELAFYVIKRPMFRVTMPHYLLLGASMMTLVKYLSDEGPAVRRWSSGGILTALTAVSATIIIVSQFTNNQYAISNPIYSDETCQVADYLETHNDNIYLAASPEVFTVDVSRPVLDFAGSDGELWNLMGNWEIYSYPYYRLMEKYGIDNPDSLLEESIDSENVLYVTSMAKECPSFILDLVYQQFGIKAHFVEVDCVPTVVPNDNPYAYLRIWKLVSD